MHAAETLAKQYPNAAIPLHIRNAPTKLMRDEGYAAGYAWKANFKHPKGFLPEEIGDVTLL